MSEKKQLIVNIFSNLMYMLINYAITFFLTSYVVSQISGEAYGFISLCNNIVNYASIITIALNSVSGRFISIEMHRGEPERAKKYFSSTLFADIIISIAILVICIPISLHLDVFFEIPNNLSNDVRTLFLLVTINLLINVITSVYSVSTFITNKLYLSSLANALGNIIRALILSVLVYFCRPSITFVGIATVGSSILVLILNMLYTKNLCPSLKVNMNLVSIAKIKELVTSGIWNSVTKLAQILSDGLDLVISNIWIGAYEMGQLSIAYNIPTIISSFISMIINVFNPKLTEYYAKKDYSKVIDELTTNMKMTGFFGNIIFFGVLIMGKDLFYLWVPSSNVEMVYRLMMFATFSVLVSSIVSPLSNVFLLTNKLKMNSLVWLFVSLFDAILVVILVSTTNLGVYAVAAVSKIVGSVVNLVFLPLYASHCLEVKPGVFYKVIKSYTISSFIVGLSMTICSLLFSNNNSWLLFVIRVCFLGFIGIITNYIFFFNKEERIYFQTKIKEKILRKLN